MKLTVCSSCGRSTYDYVKFVAPGSDGKEEIVRCAQCRETEVPWTSKASKLSGP